MLKVNAKFSTSILAASLFLAGTIAMGQQQPSAPAMGSGPSFDNMGVRDYLLGPGDELDLKFFQQPDLNSKVVVQGDGNIQVPFIDEPIKAQCRTDKELAADLRKAYEKFFKSPQLSVLVSGRFSRAPISVNGAVRDPQRIQAMRKARLNEILSFAGGPTERSNGTVQIVHTSPVMCPEPGEIQVADDVTDYGMPQSNLYDIADIVTGRPEANPYVRPGDVVTVMEAEPVYIAGSVVSPQGLYLRPGMTVFRALMMVGGPRPTAKEKEIMVYRQDPRTMKREAINVDYAAIKKQQKPDMELKPYDIIYVPEAGMLSKERILQTLAGGVLGGVSTALSSPGMLPTRILY